MFIDSHCHPYSLKEKDLETVIKNFKENWWKYIVSIWVDLKTSIKSEDLAKKYDFIFATIWIDPSESKNIIEIKNEIKKLEKLYLENKNKIVWIWEIWLDYYWIDKNNLENEKNKQKEVFISQINLARKYNLPIIIHNRESKDDLLEILKQQNYKNFIIHCFSENLDFAKKCIEFSPNCKISFSWIVTFKNAKEIQETAKNIPLENIIIETDSPYLTPVPYRWKQENEPFFTKYVLEKICELRQENNYEIEKKIFENSLSVFWI